MTAERDPLDELAAAFRALPAPPPTRELGAEDAQTQRTVAWLAAAWQAQQPARGDVAALLARRAPARSLSWRPLAAAAVLLVLLGGPLLLGLRDWTARPAAESAAHIVAAPDLYVAPSAAPASGLVAVSGNALEMRSGPVHLLLVLDHAPSTREESR